MKIFLPLVLTITALAAVAFPQDNKLRPELASLVEAERSFSSACVARGLRAAFSEFFAADGIRFLPQPVNAQENFRQSPAPAGPLSFTLSWEPIFADVSRAGDLGFTTGPYVVSDNARKNPSSHGYYFSIWQRQADGTWRVLLDLGTDTPAPGNSDTRPPFKSALSTGWKGNAAQAGLDDSTVLAKLDRETAALAATQGITAAYRHYLLNDARLHRRGLMPLVAQPAILAFLDQQQWTNVSFQPIASGMAQSADLGYSYGKYSLQHKSGPGVLEKGYYVRVWKRDGKGNWKIAMDVANALPAESTARF